jgi:hypothetical protein
MPESRVTCPDIFKKIITTILLDSQESSHLEILIAFFKVTHYSRLMKRRNNAKNKNKNPQTSWDNFNLLEKYKLVLSL